ncbi:uncharacterized protein LOC131943843 [Physella acuta]|uniref:uncharacterized protein LOC131943843 n=1 Tax=Physella acuta TaxID=109671 RepID=UPI0027DB5A18|nr:uncharacterized protein LOC131943843 [Physella acuta]
MTEGSTSPGKDEKDMTEMKALVQASIIGPICSIGIITVLATLFAVCYCRKQCWKYPICFCNQKQVCQHSGEKDEGDDNNEQSLRHEDTEPTTTLNDRRGESADPEEMNYVERQEKRQVFKVIDLHEESEYFKLEDENDNANNNCAVTSRPNLNETTTVNSREVYDISINV